jgi:DHA1 family tetracycline resistance protein-like MFS transporter
VPGVNPAPTPRSEPSAKRAPLLPIFLIVLVDIFGLTLVIPLLAIYAEKFGASALGATLLISIYAVCQLVSGPLLGRMSDKTGRKPLLLVSQLGTFLGFVLLARASALWMVYLSRVIDGSTAGNLSLAQAYISDNTEPKDRAKSFAIIGIAFGLGFFIGPFVTGNLVKYGFQAPIWLAAALSATSILCTLTLLPGGKPPAHPSGEAEGPGGRRVSILAWQSYAEYFSRPVLGGLLGQFFCYVFCFSTFTSGFALFAERKFLWDGHPYGPREIGYLLAYSGFLGIILQGALIGRLVRRFGEAKLIVAGFGSLVVGYVALGLVTTLGPLLVVTTISSFGNGVLRPTLTSLVSQRAGRHEQGAVLGLNQSMNSVAQIMAPTVAGLLIGSQQLFLWAAVASAAAFVGLVASRWGSARVPAHTAS